MQSYKIAIDKAKNSKAWPLLEAVKILEHINYKTPKKGYVLFETGYGPSGLPHLGTFAEVVRTTMVINAFKKISDIPTKLICFSDDMDALRKVPEAIPNYELMSKFLGHPLASIPDPFEQEKSYAAYMNNRLKDFLDIGNFDYELYSATECYKSGMFDDILIKILEKHEKIIDIVAPTLGDERKATYSPFLPVCPKTGKILQVAVIDTNLNKCTITYKHNNELFEVPVTGGNCKLQWKPDFAMRWAALDVDCEILGKDVASNIKIYSKICRLLGNKGPINFIYEMFLDEEGRKISKSKGNRAIDVHTWLKYSPLEAMYSFFFQSPKKAKKIYFNLIPKNVDEYLIFNSKYHEDSKSDKNLDNPCYYIHSQDVPKINIYGLTYTLLLNLASAVNVESKDHLWQFVIRYQKDVSPTKDKFLDKLVGYAINYYNDFVKPNKQYLIANEKQKNILQEIYKIIDASEYNTAEELQTKIYQIGNDNYENLKNYFSDLYKILLGQTSGPRLGSLLYVLGKDHSLNLIKQVIS